MYEQENKNGRISSQSAMEDNTAYTGRDGAGAGAAGRAEVSTPPHFQIARKD